MNFKHEEKLIQEAIAKDLQVGYCYRDIWRAFVIGETYDKGLRCRVSDLNNLRLCHGTVQPRGYINVPRHGHAWLEGEGMVINITHGELVVMMRDRAYKLGQMENVKRYTLQEAAKWSVQTDSFGPWEYEDTASVERGG